MSRGLPLCCSDANLAHTQSLHIPASGATPHLLRCVALQDPNQNRIAEVYARIQTERRIMEGYQALRSATPNQDVIRQAESKIRDAQRNISYLEESLQDLQTRRASGGAGMAAGMRTDSPTGTIPSGSGSAGPGSFGSTFSSGTSSTSVSGRPGQPMYSGDSSSSYAPTGSSSPGLNPRRYDGRPLPPPPGSDPRPGQPDPRASYQGYDYNYGGVYQGQGAPGSREGWSPAPFNRSSTSARKNFTNLGERTS